MSDDLMQITHKAMNAARERNIEMQRSMEKRVVTRPAFPESDKPDEVMALKPKDKDTRREEYLRIRSDPLLLMAFVDEQAARLNLPKHKPIPRSVVKFFLDGEREFGEA